MKMENVPQAKMDIPNYTNYQPEQEQLRLRKRLGDLMRMGAATPDTFQQAVLQIWQEAERQRQMSMTQAEEHLRKYHSCNAQAHAFSMTSSIAFAVINGFVVMEERRAQEEQRQAQERAEKEREAANLASSEAPKEGASAAPTSRRKRTPRTRS
jgi:hypothetical protein